jgi:hypothetical protein
VAFVGKAVLFVEGAFTPHPRYAEPLGRIWQTHLVQCLQLIAIDRVVPIDKTYLVAMERPEVNKKKLSGAGWQPLDLLIARELEKEDFDVAVIAWDLQPPWDPNAKACGPQEVVKLYHGLSESEALPDEPWRRWARNRFRELGGRKKGQRKPDTPSLEAGAILAVCMEPVFESLLIVCEQTIMRTLGVKHRGRVKWPTWNKHRDRPENLLQLAIKAARQVRPMPEAINRVPGDMITAKNNWDEYLLRKMIEDEQCLAEVRQHPTAARLVRLLSRGR